MAKQIIYFFLLIATIGCVSKADYEKLKVENTSLREALDECQNGADKLIAKIDKAYSEESYTYAKENILALQKRHPEAYKAERYNQMLDSIDIYIEQKLKEKEEKEKERIRLENLNNTGIWQVEYYVDEFGEETKSSFVLTDIYGTFSNSATTNSRLKVRFLIDSNKARINLYEYARNHPIKGEGTVYFKIRDKNKKEYHIQGSNGNSGDTYLFQDNYKQLLKILKTGGEIKFIAETDRYGSPSVYKFTIDNADWIDNALTKMKLTTKNE